MLIWENNSLSPHLTKSVKRQIRLKVRTRTINVEVRKGAWTAAAGVAVHTCNAASWEANTKELSLRAARPYLKIEEKNGKWKLTTKSRKASSSTRVIKPGPGRWPRDPNTRRQRRTPHLNIQGQPNKRRGLPQKGGACHRTAAWVLEELIPANCPLTPHTRLHRGAPHTCINKC